MGVIGRTANGQAHVSVTVRNYAGMSVFPEIISVSAREVSVLVKEMQYISAPEQNEKIAVSNQKQWLSFCPLNYDDSCLGSIAGSNLLKIAFNYPVMNGVGQENAFSNASYNVVETYASGKNLYLVTDVNIPSSAILDFVYNWHGAGVAEPIQLNMNQYCQPPVFEFEVTFVGEPPNDINMISVTAHEVSVEMKNINFMQGHESEKISVSAHSVTVSFLDLNGNPI